jgi:hypothetical protein
MNNRGDLVFGLVRHAGELMSANEAAKFGAALIAKGIIIDHDAKNIEPVMAPSINAHDILTSKQSAKDCPCFKCEGRMKRTGWDGRTWVGDDKVRLIIRQRVWEDVHVANDADSVGWGFPDVFDDKNGHWPSTDHEVLKANWLNGDVGPQLPFGGFGGPVHESSSGPPQRERKKDEESIGNFHAPSEERPILGSLLVAMGGLIVASACYRRFRILAVTLAFMSTVGLLFGFDLWSLAVRIM